MKHVPHTITFKPTRSGWRYLQRRAAELGRPLELAATRDFLISEAVSRATLNSQADQIAFQMKYLLLDHNNQPKACTLEQWAAWQKTDPDLGVDYTVVGDCAIGTRFQSVLPHDSAPCWETAVVGGICHGKREVCSGNRDQAEQQHQEMVRLVTEQLSKT